MEILVHHVSYADVYFHLAPQDEGEPAIRTRVNRECLEKLTRKVLALWDEKEKKKDSSSFELLYTSLYSERDLVNQDVNGAGRPIEISKERGNANNLRVSTSEVFRELAES